MIFPWILLLLVNAVTGSNEHVRHERTRFMTSRDQTFANSYYARTYGTRDPPIWRQYTWTPPQSSYDFLKRSYPRPLFNWDSPKSRSTHASTQHGPPAETPRPFFIQSRPTYPPLPVYQLRPVTTSIDDPRISSQSGELKPIEPPSYLQPDHGRNSISFRGSYVYNVGPEVGTTATRSWRDQTTPQPKRRPKFRKHKKTQKACTSKNKEKCKRRKPGRLGKKGLKPPKSTSNNTETNDIRGHIEGNMNLKPSWQLPNWNKPDQQWGTDELPITVRQDFPTWTTRPSILPRRSLCEERSQPCSHKCSVVDDSAVCSCLSGYRLVNDFECEDYNECDDQTAMCKGGECINVLGSYKCNCTKGFELSTDNHSCTDQNECLFENGGCASICTNTEGSRRCDCHQGYQLASDGTSCEDVNECDTNNGGCEGLCVNINGSRHCHCSDGFKIADDGVSCEDIDECDSDVSPCPGSCVNIVGSWHCECVTGYKWSKLSQACEDIDECLIDNGGCHEICRNSNGSRECQCNPGFAITDDGMSCVDIDECLLNNGQCNEICLNTAGSRECQCSSGYQIAGDGVSCVDINECTLGNGGCQEHCINTAGSRRCECSEGYHLADDQTSCIDVNECEVNNGECDGECVNSAGSFKCLCVEGFVLTEDKKTCVDVNECLDDNGGCQEICINSAGSRECSCPPGYKVANDGTSCEDVDECETNNGGCSNSCTNTVGSRQCGCSVGFHLTDDEASCVDINECLVNNGGCAHECVNKAGSFECACEEGYQFNQDTKACVDSNECLIANGGCEGSCINTEGSYECNCNPGYELDEDEVTCTDIDECEINNGGCKGQCVNTEGSRTCSCPEGYLLGEDGESCEVHVDACPGGDGCPKEEEDYDDSNVDDYEESEEDADETEKPNSKESENPQKCGPGYKEVDKKCMDIDECLEEKGGCQDVCVNTEGSRLCLCTQGSLADDGVTCIIVEDDEDLCEEDNGGCEQECVSRAGDRECRCYEGYELDDDEESCKDIDECRDNDGRGPCEDTCTNKEGGFTCSCQNKPGTTLSNDNRTCEELNNACLSGEAGCSHTCVSTQGHAYCTCPDGWELGEDWKTCQDINECENPEDNDVECDTECINTIGSYRCASTPKHSTSTITCPEDLVTELEPSARKTEIELERPITDLDWDTDIISEPAWGKNHTVFLGGGTFEITYSAKDGSNPCTTTLYVLEGQAPQVDQCPESQELTIPPGEDSIAPTWSEPIFEDNVEVTEVISSVSPGSVLGPGKHEIVYTAYDDVGFVAKCSFTLNITH